MRASANGTFLHTRRFLNYHKDRFEDVSMVVRDADGRIRAVFPAAMDASDPTRAISHPGATFGGLVTDPGVTGDAYRDLFEAVLEAYAALGLATIAYRAVPAAYHVVPAEEDLYWLWRLGGTLESRQLSACVDLKKRRKRRIREYARSEAVCELRSGARYLPELWAVVEATLRARHGTGPVHDVGEIVELASAFPDEIETLVALSGRRVVGGAVLFCSTNVVHMQYGISSPEGMALHSADLLVRRSIEIARERGARYFDFGISTDRDGTGLNEGLHRFKMKTGAGTIVYERYGLDVRRGGTA